METHPFDSHKNWVLELDLGSGCFVPQTCLSVSGFAPSPVTTTQYSCIGANGRPKVRAVIRSESSERSTGTIRGLTSDIVPLIKASQALQKSGCFLKGRVAVYCSPDQIGKPNALRGYYILDDLDLGSNSGIEFSRVTGVTTEALESELTASANGNVTWVDVGSSFIRADLKLDTFPEIGVGAVLIAVYNCDDNSCSFGGNCGSSRKFQPCDHWYAVATSSNGTFVLETFDRGSSWEITEQFSGATAVNADCDGVYTTAGRLRKCGISNVLESLPSIGYVPLVKDGAYNVLLYAGHGVFVYNETLGKWQDALSDSLLASPSDPAPQHHIATNMGSNGTVIVTGGESDGVLNGAYYQVSLDRGVSWKTYRYNDATFPTTSGDTILDVAVNADDVISMLVTNGTTTRLVVSYDGGESWETTSAWNGVYLDGVITQAGFTTYVKLDNNLWANHSGLCSCGWTLIKSYDDCFDIVNVCASDTSVIVNACA